MRNYGYNTRLGQFPANLIGRVFGEYFEVGSVELERLNGVSARTVCGDGVSFRSEKGAIS